MPPTDAGPVFATWVATPSDSSFVAKDSGSGWWVLDSGSSSHITQNCQLISNYEDIAPITFRTAKREVSFTAIGKGTATIILPHQSGPLQVVLTDVLYAPDCDANLISVKALGKKGVKSLFLDTECTLYLNGKVVSVIPCSGTLFWVSSPPSQPSAISSLSSSALLSEGPKVVDLKVWHSRFGHVNYQMLTKLAKSGIVTGMNVSSFQIDECNDCVVGKLDCMSFPASPFVPKAPLDLIYYDLMGKFPVLVVGSIYAMTIFDAGSGYLSVFFLKDKKKESTLACLSKWVPWVERQSGHMVKTITTDGGGEFVNSLWEDYCST